MFLKTRGTGCAALAVVLSLTSAGAQAQTPGTKFTYQGRLIKDGVPVGSSTPVTCNFTFGLWNALVAGGQVGSSPQNVGAVQVADGLFTVPLDFGAGAFSGASRWLEISVQCPGDAVPVTLPPRQELTPAPYSMRSSDTDRLDGLDSTAFGRLAQNQTWTGVNSYSTAPSFTAGGAPFSVTGNSVVSSLNADLLDGKTSTDFLPSAPPIFVAGSINGAVFHGSNSGNFTEAVGVLGTAGGSTLQTHAVRGDNSNPVGIGVFGRASSLTGGAIGVLGQTFSPGGYAVLGQSFANSGTSAAVYGTTSSSSGMGVYGAHNVGSGGGNGVRGDSSSTSGAGVYALSSAGSGGTYGLLADNYSPDGHAVFARAFGTTSVNYGVRGQTYSTNGGGGVLGEALPSSGVIYGVRGLCNSPSGFAGFFHNPNGGEAGRFLGNTVVTGTKSFLIDHPLDPQNKYLRYYCAEGPQPLNTYTGSVQLDENGERLVALPDHVEAINRDFRYQLTCVGGFAPVYIAEKIENHEFKIAGGTPGLEVSWTVTGVRNDAWVRTHGAPTEIPKAPHERGKYLHPDLFGEPDELRIHPVPDRPAPTAEDSDVTAGLTSSLQDLR